MQYTKGTFIDGNTGWKAHNNGRHWNNTSIDNWEILWSDIGEWVVDHVYEESDARLIEKAPEMYEAIKEILEVFDAKGGVNPLWVIRQLKSVLPNLQEVTT